MPRSAEEKKRHKHILLLQGWPHLMGRAVGEDRAIESVKLDQHNSKVKRISKSIISISNRDNSCWQMKVISIISLSLSYRKRRVAKLSSRLVKQSEVRVSRANLDASNNNLWVQKSSYLRTLKTSRCTTITVICPKPLQNCLEIMEPLSIRLFHISNQLMVLASNNYPSRLSRRSKKSKCRQLYSLCIYNRRNNSLKTTQLLKISYWTIVLNPRLPIAAVCKCLQILRTIWMRASSRERRSRLLWELLHRTNYLTKEEEWVKLCQELRIRVLRIT